MRSGINLATLTEYEEVMGINKLNDVLLSFSCPINQEVESYIREKAYRSTKLSSSVTYLAIDSASGEIVGYFTLMMKAYSVKSDLLNSTNRRLVKRCAELDANGNFTAAVYLIAQLGKNFALPKNRQVSGAELLSMALGLFRGTKKVLGGKLVMVEREADSPKLLEFYTKNGFKSWTRRINEKDGKKKVEFDQMFAVLNDEPPTGGPGA